MPKRRPIRVVGPGGKLIPWTEWDFGYGKGVLGPGGVPPTGPAPATSATPATPTFDPNAPLPVDAAYDAEIGGLQRSLDTQLGVGGVPGSIGQERQRGLMEYGFTETGYDPNTGTMGALALDPNNPFSKAALLKKSFDTARARAGQTMASGGQLYSGAYQNQQDLVNRGQLQDEDALQKSLAGFLAANADKRTQALTDYELGGARAYGDRVGRALTNPLYNPLIGGGAATDVAPGTDPAAPTTSTPTPKPTPKPKARPLTIKAGPKVKATKRTTVSRKRKGRTVTYTTSVKGP